MKILVSGGKGFIGSHMVDLLCRRYTEAEVINIDAETYAARPPLNEVAPPNLRDIKIDIRNRDAVRKVMKAARPDLCFHLAAESHVCRSIRGPEDFVTTNVLGTFNMLEEFRNEAPWGRFIHVSTDEVYGQALTGQFTEISPLRPRNPYAASKAGGDMLVRAYSETFALDVRTIRMANNFGPNQHEEKLIPRTISHMIQGLPVIVHGKGNHIREWLHVSDACYGILLAAIKGSAGGVYCLGGSREMTNLDMIQHVANCIAQICPDMGFNLSLKHTDDRPTDDFRYAMDGKMTRHILEWAPSPNFNDQLFSTVKSYVDVMLLGDGGAIQGRRA